MWLRDSVCVEILGVSQSTPGGSKGRLPGSVSHIPAEATYGIVGPHRKASCSAAKVAPATPETILAVGEHRSFNSS